MRRNSQPPRAVRDLLRCASAAARAQPHLVEGELAIVMLPERGGGVVLFFWKEREGRGGTASVRQGSGAAAGRRSAGGEASIPRQQEHTPVHEADGLDAPALST